MNKPNLHGGCLCGAVRYEVSPPYQRVLHCHCSRCRKSTGTGHATNFIVEPRQLKWLSGEDLVTRYDLPTARSFAKCFCSRCGCPVPRLTRNGTLVVVPMGSLDDEPPFKPTDHIYWESRAPWGCPSGGLPKHAEYPESWK